MGYHLVGLEALNNHVREDVDSFLKSVEIQLRLKKSKPDKSKFISKNKKFGLKDWQECCFHAILSEWNHAKETGARRGSLFHQCIAYILKNKCSIGFGLEKTCGNSSEEDRRFVEVCLAQISPLLCDFVDDGWGVVAVEQPILLNERIAGSFDLLLEKQNKYWLIDFKTTHHPHTSSSNARDQRLAGVFGVPSNWQARWCAQLNAYRQAIAASSSINVSRLSVVNVNPFHTRVELIDVAVVDVLEKFEEFIDVLDNENQEPKKKKKRSVANRVTRPAAKKRLISKKKNVNKRKANEITEEEETEEAEEK